MRKHLFRRLRCHNRCQQRRMLLEVLESRFALTAEPVNLLNEVQQSEFDNTLHQRITELDAAASDRDDHRSATAVASARSVAQNLWPIMPTTRPEAESIAEVATDVEIAVQLMPHQVATATVPPVPSTQPPPITGTTEFLVSPGLGDLDSETGQGTQPSPDDSIESSGSSTSSPAIDDPSKPPTITPPAQPPLAAPVTGPASNPVVNPNPISPPSFSPPALPTAGPPLNPPPALTDAISLTPPNASSTPISTPIPSPTPSSTPAPMPSPGANPAPSPTPNPSTSGPIPTPSATPTPLIPPATVPPTAPQPGPVPIPVPVVPSAPVPIPIPTPVPSQIPKPPPTPTDLPSAISNPQAGPNSPAVASPASNPSPGSPPATDPAPAAPAVESCAPASASLDDGKPLDARDDDVLKNKQQTKLINVLANDSIHRSESFTHRSTIVASGNSGVPVTTMNGADGESFYWFQELSGTSTLKTLEDGATAQVVLSGFHFEQDLGRRCGNQQWASWTGGTIVISSDWGTRSISNVSFTGGVVIDRHGDFGQATGTFTDQTNSLQLALPAFDGRKAEQTIDGRGLLVFASPPKLSITTPPKYGTATIVDGQISYQPRPGTEGVDSLQYQIMTELGDRDSATINIGTMDLDVFTLAGNELDEIKEDNPGLWIMVNDDDDNTSRVRDFRESGFADDDLAKITLEELAPQGLRPLHGYFTLSFDSQVIRIWHTRFKNVTPDFDEAEVISNSTRFYVGGSQWDDELWIEGQASGQTEIALAWQDLKEQIAAVVDSVQVHVLKYDFDIDSDNNNGFNYPDNSEWEEFLEANKYGIGKMIEPNASHFTPTRLRLPTDLPLDDPSLRVKFDFRPAAQSGILLAWNTFKADRNRVDRPVGEGGNRVLASTEYSLRELGYDPVSGGITLYLEAWRVFPGHATKKEVDENPLIDDRIKAVLLRDGQPILWDEVKYMTVEPDTFYPHLQIQEPIRNAIASAIVYDPGKDDPKFALKLLSPEEMLRLGMPPKLIEMIGPTTADGGFKNSMYLDHISGKLVMAFAGTDDLQDWLTDIWQGLGGYTAQYKAAVNIGRQLATIANLEDRIVITGHSLGGGLASAAAVASRIHADTFNAAGLLENNFYYDELGNSFPGYPQELATYNAAAGGGGPIDAYYLDYDLLSFIQDYTPLQNAVGHRILMDGPVDLELGLLLVGLQTSFANDSSWQSALLSLGGSTGTMIKCHTTHYYHYGLMVNESSGWDIYGYDDF